MHHVPDPWLIIVSPPNRALTKVFSHIAVERAIAQTIVSVGRKTILVKNNRSTDGHFRRLAPFSPLMQTLYHFHVGVVFYLLGELIALARET